MPKPRIAAMPNGPCYLINEPQPVEVPNLGRQSGATCANVRGVALCRCGGSKNKPFCDGTHSAIGFSDRKLSDGADNRRSRYAGKRVTIFDNRAICSHAGHCSDGLKSVFLYGKEPWIDPDGAALGAIIATIRQCPSRALRYALPGSETQGPAPPP